MNEQFDKIGSLKWCFQNYTYFQQALHMALTLSADIVGLHTPEPSSFGYF